MVAGQLLAPSDIEADSLNESSDACREPSSLLGASSEDRGHLSPLTRPTQAQDDDLANEAQF